MANRVEVISGAVWRCSGRAAAFFLAAALAVVAPPNAQARITRMAPLQVHILLDNSGSMYPGYRPGGGVSKNETGALFYREYPWFEDWLNDFVRRQTILNGEEVALSAFTSDRSFSPEDVRLVQPFVSPGEFDAAEVLGRIEGWGKSTNLAASLEEVSEGFEGLVWLITDNIVETGRGTPDLEVKRFFQSLRDTSRYRSVHLLKLPVEDAAAGVESALAVYGMLVSPEPVDHRTAAFFDRKFRETFRTATRPSRSGGPLFPGHSHLKLKDLNIAPFDLQFDPNLEVDLIDQDREMMRELQKVELKLRGQIHSNLTQHSVVGGRYTLEVVTPFMADPKSTRELGLPAIEPSMFDRISGALSQRIPPNGNVELAKTLPSKRRIALSTNGFSGWLQSALHGVQAEYSGEVEMRFEGIEVRFERDRMVGVFGTEAAPEVFDFEDVSTIHAEPERARISFQVTGSSLSSFLLLLLLVLVLAIVGATAYVLLKPRRYRITVRRSQTVIALRRMQSHRVHNEGQLLGTLVRPLNGQEKFHGPAHDPDVQVEERERIDGQRIELAAHVYESGTVPITIEIIGGKKSGRGGAVRPTVRGPSSGRRAGDRGTDSGPTEGSGGTTSRPRIPPPG